jgi:hypothetical protein
MKKWLLPIIVLLTVMFVIVIWAISSGRLTSRKKKMLDRFRTIQQYIDPRDLQIWATNNLARRSNGPLKEVPSFLTNGYSETHFLSASTFIHQQPETGTRTVQIAFGDVSDSWYLIVGYENFILPITNSVNQDYCLQWIPGVYFCYEK